jgi:hypothetical protein
VRWKTPFFIAALLLGELGTVHAQSPQDIVRQAVQTELNASANDHTHWLYFEFDQEPNKTVKQWIAQTREAELQRVLERNGQKLSESEQRKELEDFLHDTRRRARQHKSEQHDDEQAEELLRILPDAFIWTRQGESVGSTQLHFVPNPQFRPPDLEARVFAAMEGDMAVNNAEHRIASLKGRLIHPVKFGYGLLGELQEGGTFDVERRKTGASIWQITETHVHIQGHVLFFKTISEQEDDVKSSFRRLPDNLSLQQAETELFDQNKLQLSSVR